MKFNTVVVGAGFAGSVIAERLATEKGEKVLIIEKKNHIGGNCYDNFDDNGVLVHKYGPHIFHTQSKNAWDYVNRFSKFRVYHHRVLGVIDGQKTPIPFNINSLYQLFPESLARRIEVKLVEKFGMNKKVPILRLKKADDADLKLVADYVYEKIFAFYTEKQWGLKPEDLSEEVTGRVPVYISRDDRYFQDRYQGMPAHSYTRIFENILDHPNIKILLNTDYKEVIDDLEYDRLVYTGPIDYFFDYKFGKLKYRTLDFEWEHIPNGYFQEVGTVNYPNNYGFTRITDYKRLTGQNCPGTTTMKEFPREAVIGKDLLYYPMFTDEWKAKYSEYEKEARKLDNIIFLGRLAQYRYYNMDQAILASLEAFETIK